MTRYFYAAVNERADLDHGNHGFANTWTIERFDSRAKRDAFVIEYGAKLARAVTRREAASIFAANYTCVGEKVPHGGLFSGDAEHFDEWLSIDE